MGRLLTSLAFCVAVLLAAGLFVPPFIDWSHLRAPFEKQVADELAGEVRIKGGIDVQILPVPVIMARDVEATLTSGEHIEIRRLAATLDWNSLIGPDVTVTGLTAKRPSLQLVPGRSFVQLVQELSVGSMPTLAQISVDKGTVTAADGRAVAKKINVEWRADQSMERFSADGSVRDVKMRASGTVKGEPGDDARPRPVRLRLEVPDEGLETRFNGTTQTGGFWPLAGEWTLKASSLSKLEGAVRRLTGYDTAPPEALSAFLSKPVEATAKARFSLGTFETSDTVLDIGTQRFSVTASYKGDDQARPHLDLAMQIQTLAVEQIVDGPAAGPRADQILGWLQPVAVPQGFDGFDADLSLSVSSLLWNEAVLQNVTVRGVLTDGFAGLADLSGVMPGGAEIAIAGLPAAGQGDALQTGASQDTASWSGQARLTAAHPRAFLEWLGAPVEDIPPGRFGKVDLDSVLTVSSDRVLIDDVSLRMNDGLIDGTADLRFGPTLSATVVGMVSGLALDPYWPLIAPALEPRAEAQGGTGAAGFWGERADLRFDLTAQQVQAANRAWDWILLKGRMTEERIVFDRMDGWSADGTTVSAVLDLPQQEHFLVKGGLGGRLAMRVEAPDAQTILSAAPIPEGARSGAPESLTLSVDASFEDDRLKGTVGGLLGETRIAGVADLIMARDSHRDPWDQPSKGTASFTIEAQDGMRLARLLNLGGLIQAADSNDPGHVRAKLSFENASGLADISLTLPQVETTAKAQLSFRNGDWTYVGQADLTVDALPIPVLLAPDETSALRLTSPIRGTTHSVALTRIDGRVGEATLAGSLTLDHLFTDGADTIPAPKPTLGGTIEIGGLALEPFASQDEDKPVMSDGTEPELDAPWPTAPLPITTLNAVTANLVVSIDLVTIGGLIVERIAVPIVLDDKGLSIPDLRAILEGGVLKGAVTARPQGEEIALNVALSLEDLSPDVTGTSARQSDEQPAARIAWDGAVRADLASHGRSAFELVSNLTGAVAFDLSESTLTPFDLDGFATSWPGIDSLKDFEGALALAARSGRTRVKGLTGEAAMAGGILMVDGLKAATDRGGVDLQGTVNLPAFLIDLDAGFTVADEASPLRLRVAGPLDGRDHVLDASDLRYDLALRIKASKAGRITEDDLPKELLDLLETLEDEGQEAQE